MTFLDKVEALVAWKAALLLDTGDDVRHLSDKLEWLHTSSVTPIAVAAVSTTSFFPSESAIHATSPSSIAPPGAPPEPDLRAVLLG
ncbi:hypothetical protein E2562_005706 [Oryza meyeriana var. granulata]|uniref:Uncharacterized protein n=1 Tax=Oryza meyeriana var. granulata TaxID=110450 RepID=A0A6G1F4B5_9ORYZ|nr:hypothetical protein E2562_005706 [Oryza meyeriana var. granulata]